jgi:hypothetical protein
LTTSDRTGDSGTLAGGVEGAAVVTTVGARVVVVIIVVVVVVVEGRAGSAFDVVAVFTDLDTATVPFETVVHGDSLTSFVDGAHDDGTETLGAVLAVRRDVGTNDVASVAEEVFEILPTDREGEVANVQGTSVDSRGITRSREWDITRGTIGI